ncbi:MAG: hypothetical protein R3B37_08550 [Nitrospira sp.]|nr:hypothetical protein [Nitrospira sp.]
MAEKTAFSRWRFLWDCVNPYLRRLLLGYTVLGAITWVRDELLPIHFRDHHLLDFLPNWPWHLWITLLMLILVVLLGEALYQRHCLLEATQKKSIYEASGQEYRPVPKRGFTTSIVIPLALVLVVAFVWLTYKPTAVSTNDQIHSVAQINPSIPAPSHAVLIRFMPGNLPIIVDPQSVAYVLQLNPNITRWAWEVPNGGGKALQWPSDLKTIKGGPPGDSIYVCEITNHEDKTLMDVTIPFSVSFHELDMVPVTVKHNKNGSESVTIPTPGLDHIVVTLGHPKHAKDLTAARDGVLVKAFTAIDIYSGSSAKSNR